MKPYHPQEAQLKFDPRGGHCSPSREGLLRAGARGVDKQTQGWRCEEKQGRGAGVAAAARSRDGRALGTAAAGGAGGNRGGGSRIRAAVGTVLADTSALEIEVSGGQRLDKYEISILHFFSAKIEWISIPRYF